nr:hypothetical protein Iba_chr11aCG10590 [Ipomoea batatas]
MANSHKDQRDGLAIKISKTLPPMGKIIEPTNH